MAGEKYDFKVDVSARRSFLDLTFLCWVAIPTVSLTGKVLRGVQCFSLGVVTVEVLTNKQAEEIPRVEFSMSGRNKHAHMGIGAVDEKKLRPMLDAVLAGDDPAPATLVEMAMACLKSVARDRPAMGELCEELARVRAALPPCEVVVSPRQPA
eukprot:COSAG04_NODE_1968_length_5112_cov_3.258328_4_plen_153_part_00